MIFIIIFSYQYFLHWKIILNQKLSWQAQDPQMLDQLSKNITRCGLSNSTLNYLRVSSHLTLAELCNKTTWYHCCDVVSSQYTLLCLLLSDIIKYYFLWFFLKIFPPFSYSSYYKLWTYSSWPCWCFVNKT